MRSAPSALIVLLGHAPVQEAIVLLDSDSDVEMEYKSTGAVGARREQQPALPVPPPKAAKTAFGASPRSATVSPSRNATVQRFRTPLDPTCPAQSPHAQRAHYLQGRTVVHAEEYLTTEGGHTRMIDAIADGLGLVPDGRAALHANLSFVVLDGHPTDSNGMPVFGGDFAKEASEVRGFSS